MTTGPTSPDTDHGPVLHGCRLVERHQITTDITGASVDAMDPDHWADLYAALFDQARTWHAAHGLEPVDLAQLSPQAKGLDDVTVGVAWTVTVGRGDISDDQRLPGVMDSWRWSARFHHWRRVFNRLDGRQGRLLAARDDARGATVTKLFPDRDMPADAKVPWSALPPELPPFMRPEG